MTRVRVADSYFDVRRFEALINNDGIKREKKVIKKRTLKFIDNLLKIVAVTVMVLVIVAFCLNIYFVIKTTYQGIKISELTKTCEILNDKKTNMVENLRLSGAYENVKKKAYSDLNMITPEKDNIIYFEK